MNRCPLEVFQQFAGKLDFQDVLALRATSKHLLQLTLALPESPVRAFPTSTEIEGFLSSRDIDRWFSRQTILSYNIKPIPFCPLLLILEACGTGTLLVRIDCAYMNREGAVLTFAFVVKSRYELRDGQKVLEKLASVSKETQLLCDALYCDFKHSNIGNRLSAKGCSAVSAIVDGDFGQCRVDGMIPPHWMIFQETESNSLTLYGLERGCIPARMTATAQYQGNRKSYLGDTKGVYSLVSELVGRYRSLYAI